MRDNRGDARKLESRSRFEQGTLWGVGDFGYTEAPAFAEGSEANDATCGDPHEIQGAENKISVTIIVKQAGFYGSQLSSTVFVHPDSHLLRAMAAERQKGKDPLEWLSNKVTQKVRAFLCVVFGVSKKGCTPRAHVADHPDDATEA